MPSHSSQNRIHHIRIFPSWWIDSDEILDCLKRNQTESITFVRYNHVCTFIRLSHAVQCGTIIMLIRFLCCKCKSYITYSSGSKSRYISSPPTLASVSYHHCIYRLVRTLVSQDINHSILNKGMKFH